MDLTTRRHCQTAYRGAFKICYGMWEVFRWIFTATFGLLLMGLLWTAGGLQAEEASIAFDQANKLYEQGKYGDAADAYERLVSSGTEAPEVFFNLGNAQYKSGQMGKAIAAYRRAAALAPRDPDIHANLDFARQQVAIPTLRMNWMQRQIEWLTLNEWALIALMPVWLWFALMIGVRIHPALSQSLRGIKLTAGVVALLGIGALSCVLIHHRNRHAAVVISRNAVVRYGPYAESPNAFTVADGAEVRLLDAQDGWFRISAGPKHAGWVGTNALVLLP